MRQGGGSCGGVGVSAGARRWLDGSLVVGAVVAPAEAHTVLLLVEQVGRLVGHGHRRPGGVRGGAGDHDHSGGLHSVVELRRRELDLSELTVCGLGCFVHP